MSRRLAPHLSTKQATPSTSAAIACALLFDIDANRHKGIDRYIDYFGAGRTTVAPPAPCGEGPKEDSV